MNKFIHIGDGLVHLVQREEDEGHYGITFCRAAFSYDPVHIAFNDDVHEAKAGRPPVTCFQCLAKEHA